jgi:dihydroxy-acid dehydratase
MSNGTDGMRYSLVSRDVIENSIQWYDVDLAAIPGCDKNMPGSVMAMGRLNRPAIMESMVYSWKMERRIIEYCFGI